MKKICAFLILLLLLFALAGCGETVTYEVRFEMNGGTLVRGELLQTVEEGESADAPRVEREGYTFVGWSDSFKHVTSNMVIVAEWERNEVPETPVPETPVPETPAPETPVPETPAPETPAPETPVPETPAPETPVPETPPPTPTPDPFDTYYQDLVDKVNAYDSKITVPSKGATLREDEIYTRYVQGAYGQGIILMDRYKGEKLAVVAEGTKIKVLAEQEGCAFGRLEDGRYGWLRLDRLVATFDAELSHQRKVDYVVKRPEYWTAKGWREWILENASDFPDNVVEAARNG